MDQEYGYPPLPDFKKEVEEEISSIKKILGAFPSTRQMLFNTWIFVALVVVLNIFFLIFEPDFFSFWIVSAFLIYMFNWMILMIPSSRSRPCGVLPMIKGTGKDEGTATIREMIGKSRRARAQANGPKKKIITKRRIRFYGEILWNIFFINSQPLAPMFILVFAINILFAGICLASGILIEQRTAVIVIIQAVAIIAYYASIWHMKPYTPGFFTDIFDVRRDYQQKKINEGIRSAMFFTMLFGMFLAIGGTLIIMAMLMPGLAFGRILSIENFNADLVTLLKLVLVLISQVVLFRISQGIFSTQLLRSSFRDRLGFLEKTMIPQIQYLVNRHTCAPDNEIDLLRLEREYVGTRIYKPTCHNLFGLLYVYVIAPDIMLIANRLLKIEKRIDELEVNQVSVHSTTAP